MDSVICPLVNWSLSIFNIVANVTYIFCLVCPLHGEKIKQPLKFLLGSLSCGIIAFVVSGIALLYFQLTMNKLCFILASFVVFVCSFFTSLTSSVGLSFFYYSQIVPAQRALFIWIKKNIKAIIVCSLLLDKIFSLIIAGVMIREYIILANVISDIFSSNETAYHETVHSPIVSSEFGTNVYMIAVTVLDVYLIFCLCIMVMSNGATVVYLCRHIRRMVANGQSSCSRLSSQVRVTATGIIQGALSVLCAVWTVLYCFTQNIPSMFNNVCLDLIVINLYVSGTTLCLGAGQAVFRHRAADIWTRATQRFKPPRAHQSEQRA